MSPVVFAWLAASTAVFVAANAVLKTYAQSGGVWVLTGALALFCVGNTLMVQVMRSNGLGPVSYTHLDVYKRQPLPPIRSAMAFASSRKSRTAPAG